MSTDFHEQAPVNEQTPLVLALDRDADLEENVPDINENVSGLGDDELERPWPATMDRSFSLLAGPTLDTKFVDKITKSPKVTPFQASLVARKKYRDKHAQTAAPEFPDKPTLVRMQSLDYSPNSGTFRPKSSNDAVTTQLNRLEEAKAYRKSLLERKVEMDQSQKKKKSVSPSNRILSKQEEDVLLTRSPGYIRELQTKEYKQELQASADSHGGISSSGEKATFEQCIFNLANILMGVGMLALPYVFKRSGWIGGTFVTLSFSSVAWRTTILLGRELNGDPRPVSFFSEDSTKAASSDFPIGDVNRMRKQISSFPDIARASFGQGANIFLSSILYFELFSCLCIFLVSIGDHLHMMIPHVSMNLHMIFVAALLVVPTALLRTPKLLSYLSAVGTFSTIAIVLAVLTRAAIDGDISEQIAEKENFDRLKPLHTLWDTSGLPISFGLIAYAFSGHAVVPSIYKSMKNTQEFEKVVNITFAGVTFCCLIVALSGYHMFGATVDDQVTLSLQKSEPGGSSKAMMLLTWLMILTAFSKFTLTAFPLALGLEEIVAIWIPSDRVMEVVSSFIKICLISLALLVAIFIPSFSFLCSLVGLVCTMIVSVIFPAAAHLRLFGTRLPLWEKIIDYFFILCGVVMAIAGTYATVN